MTSIRESASIYDIFSHLTWSNVNVKDIIQILPATMQIFTFIHKTIYPNVIQRDLNRSGIKENIKLIRLLLLERKPKLLLLRHFTHSRVFECKYFFRIIRRYKIFLSQSSDRGAVEHIKNLTAIQNTHILHHSHFSASSFNKWL